MMVSSYETWNACTLSVNLAVIGHQTMWQHRNSRAYIVTHTDHEQGMVQECQDLSLSIIETMLEMCYV